MPLVSMFMNILIGEKKIIRASAPEKQQSAYHAKTKGQISCAINAQLISAFVFATRIAQFQFYLIPKFQIPSLLL